MMTTLGGSKFQGGPALEVFSASGTDPLRRQDLLVEGRVKRQFEKDVKSFVLLSEGGPNSKVELPRVARKKGLGLTQHVLALQIMLPSSSAEAFSMELVVLDTERTRRRLVIASGFRTVVSHPLHAQLPLAAAYDPSFGAKEDTDHMGMFCIPRGIWITMCIDLYDLMKKAFQQILFKSLEAIKISGSFKIRKIFTLKVRPEGLFMSALEEPMKPIPRQFQFPAAMHGSPPTIFYDFDHLSEWMKRGSSPKHASPPKKKLQHKPSPRVSKIVSKASPEIDPRVESEREENESEGGDLERLDSPSAMKLPALVRLEQRKKDLLKKSPKVKSNFSLGLASASLSSRNQQESFEEEYASARPNPDGHDNKEGGDDDKEADVLDEDDAISLGDGGDKVEEHQEDHTASANEAEREGEGNVDLVSALQAEREKLAQMEAQLETEENLLLDVEEEDERAVGVNAVTDVISEELSLNEKKLEKNESLTEMSEKFLNSTIEDALEKSFLSKENEELVPTSKEMDLIFDPILNCFFCPKNNKYYQMKH